MKEIAIFKVIMGRYDDDRDCYEDNVVQSSEFQTIEDDEYNLLRSYILNGQNYQCDRFVMIEKKDVKSEEVLSIFEQAKKLALQDEENKKKQAASEKKRKEKLAKTAAERKRKQLEKLKRELGEV